MPKLERRILRSNRELTQRMAEDPLVGIPENSEKYSEISKYPCLIIGEYRVRCHPVSGEIFISSWRTKPSQEPKENETVIFQRGEGNVQQVNLRWNRYQDINTAIRGASHILERYDKKEGVAVQNTRKLIKGLSGILVRFQTGEINKDNLDEIPDEAITLLAEARYLDAEKPIKQEIARRFMSMVKRDSLGRVNPMISRSIGSATWVRLTRELLFAGDVREKYLSILMILEGEKTYEKLRLDQAGGILQRITEILVSSRQLEKETAFLKGFAGKYLIPPAMKAAPYRRLGLTALATLFGVRTEKGKKLIREMFGENPEKAEELISIMPIDVILETGQDRNSAVGRMKERIGVAQELINLALEN